MEPEYIYGELVKNAVVFVTLLNETDPAMQRWKPAPDKWCMLEIVCHLYDEEREDFRARLKHVFETPELPLPSINPLELVTSRNYMGQNFTEKLKAFMDERQQTISWLKGLKDPKWDNAYVHPKYGPLTAKMFLVNWAAHDYLHIRQILKLKHEYLVQHGGVDLRYAGEW